MLRFAFGKNPRRQKFCWDEVSISLHAAGTSSLASNSLLSNGGHRSVSAGHTLFRAAGRRDGSKDDEYVHLDEAPILVGETHVSNIDVTGHGVMERNKAD